jgi:hypothetical protein
MVSIENTVQAQALFAGVIDILKEPNADLRRLLLDCQRACHLLEWSEREEWCQRELYGYPTQAKTPAYRLGYGELRWRFDGSPYDLVRSAVAGDAADDETTPFSELFVIGLADLLAGAQQGANFPTKESKQKYVRSIGSNVTYIEIKHYPASAYSRVLQHIQGEIYSFALKSVGQLQAWEEEFTPAQKLLASVIRHQAKEKNMQPGKPTQIIYNITGANTRINTNSVDASVNIVNTSSDRLFEEMRKTVAEKILDGGKQSELLKIIGEMEASKDDKPRFFDRYTAFVAVLADHVGLMSAFLPALGQLLGS